MFDWAYRVNMISTLLIENVQNTSQINSNQFGQLMTQFFIHLEYLIVVDMYGVHELIQMVTKQGNITVTG